jgi:hypothetical protein
MTSKEWLEIIKTAKDYSPQMTALIEKYGELVRKEAIAEITKIIEGDGRGHGKD